MLLSEEEVCKKQIAGLLSLVMLATNEFNYPTAADDTTTPPLHTQGLFNTQDPCHLNQDCDKRIAAMADFNAAFNSDNTLTEADWYWPRDEGLFNFKVISDQANAAKVYEGRGAGWFNEWELYLRYGDVADIGEDFLAQP